MSQIKYVENYLDTYDPNKIAISDFEAHICEFHKLYPGKDFAACTCSFTYSAKYVDAKWIEEECPHCKGTGKVKKKVPK